MPQTRYGARPVPIFLDPVVHTPYCDLDQTGKRGVDPFAWLQTMLAERRLLLGMRSRPSCRENAPFLVGAAGDLSPSSPLPSSRAFCSISAMLVCVCWSFLSRAAPLVGNKPPRLKGLVHIADGVDI